MIQTLWRCPRFVQNPRKFKLDYLARFLLPFVRGSFRIPMITAPQTEQLVWNIFMAPLQQRRKKNHQYGLLSKAIQSV